MTDDSVLLYGTKGRPVKLRGHIWNVAAAFRRPTVRNLLPQSISGLWKADLFTGNSDTDKWIGTTLKINRAQLEGGRGLRLGIIPANEGESDAIIKDDNKNLVICPLPYDRSFMQAFYQAWEVVVQFLAADAQIPKEVSLPRPPSPTGCEIPRGPPQLSGERRDRSARPLAQSHLLRTMEDGAAVIETRRIATETTTALLAPMPKEQTR